MKGQKTLFRFKKSKVASTEKNRKKWSNTLIAIVATAIIIGTAFGMGMLQLLKGQGATGGSGVTASEQMRKEELKVGGTVEQTPAPKEEKTKAQTGTSLDPMKLFLFKEESILLKKRDRPLLKSGKVMEV